MLKRIWKLSPGRIIALGVAAVILIGSGLLMLPISIQPGQEIHYIDALYTSTSAVCVTGLIAIDPGTAFTPIGRFFLAINDGSSTCVFQKSLKSTWCSIPFT